MCGFIAYFPLGKNKFNKKKFIDSSKYISHRGPDNNKSFFHRDINLIFYRLRIRDLTIYGDQPMFSYSKKNIIVFNGEIYNSDKLKKRLDIKNLKSNSDTEILINLYEKYGPSIINELEGMFSFVIYNFSQKKIIAARDRFGIKPIYYYKNNEYILFASEIKPIIKYTKKKNFNDLAFANFFLKQQLDNDDLTFFENIKAIPPANLLNLSIDQPMKIKKYWDITLDHSKLANSQVTFQNLFDRSVNKHLISDCEVGLLFSGGTDSTALALNMAKNKKNSLKTFTYDFSNNFIAGESQQAKIISNKLNIKNFLSIVNPNYIKTEFDKMCLELESPFTSIRLFGVKKVYENIRINKIKVAVEGGGGDEILGGYQYNYLNYLLDKIKKNKKNINEFLLDLLKDNTEQSIVNKLITLSYQEGSTKDCTPFINLNCFNKDFIRTYLKEEFYRSDIINQNINFLQKSQLKDILKVNLPRSLKYMDRLAMVSGVENRVPFLDHKLAQYSFHLSNNQKIKNGESRHILKNIYRKKKYTNFFTKQKKTIVDPQRDWLRFELREFFEDEINSKHFKQNNYFDSKNILKSYDKFLKNTSTTSFNLFQIFTASKFMKNFKDF
jgi:asparagine synthase (glutamine-hydrolysing)